MCVIFVMCDQQHTTCTISDLRSFSARRFKFSSLLFLFSYQGREQILVLKNSAHNLILKAQNNMHQTVSAHLLLSCFLIFKLQSILFDQFFLTLGLHLLFPWRAQWFISYQCRKPGKTKNILAGSKMIQDTLLMETQFIKQWMQRWVSSEMVNTGVNMLNHFKNS